MMPVADSLQEVHAASDTDTHTIIQVHFGWLMATFPIQMILVVSYRCGHAREFKKYSGTNIAGFTIISLNFAAISEKITQVRDHTFSLQTAWNVKSQSKIYKCVWRGWGD